MDKSRRKLLSLMALSSVASPFSVFARIAETPVDPVSTFRYIYENYKHRDEFYNFLANVFHLYPEDALHQLIADISSEHDSDEIIYRKLQERISEVKPFLSEFSYAIPALKKQKNEMARQTVELLSNTQSFEGYLELGTTGRYLDALEENLEINGDRFFVSEKAPTNSPQDIIDRGQLTKAGTYSSLNDYKSKIGSNIPTNSLDLVTVYIGFHHCPVKLREEFIASIRDVMKPGGHLILRDHDARNEKMFNMVALAHDVFNMGTNETWNYNHEELRNFYSLDTLDKMLTSYGFKSDGRRLFQKGDPTLNALMLYKKV